MFSKESQHHVGLKSIFYLFLFIKFSDRFLKGIIFLKVSSSLVVRFSVSSVGNKILTQKHKHEYCALPITISVKS